LARQRDVPTVLWVERQREAYGGQAIPEYQPVGCAPTRGVISSASIGPQSIADIAAIPEEAENDTMYYKCFGGDRRLGSDICAVPGSVRFRACGSSGARIFSGWSPPGKRAPFARLSRSKRLGRLHRRRCPTRRRSIRSCATRRSWRRRIISTSVTRRPQSRTARL